MNGGVLPFSTACERNKAPILAVIEPVLAGCRRLLEIGSGTGQHATWLGARLPWLVWQPTELPDAVPMLQRRLAQDAPPNVLPAIALDVADQPWPGGTVDAVFSANTLHIMGWDRVEAFFRGAGEALAEGGVLAVYGPFRYRGDYTSTSNADFDVLLRRCGCGSGIRDFEAADELARQAGMALIADHPMPANNQTLIWKKGT